VIRCCSRDAFPASYSTFGNGCAGSQAASTLSPVALPRLGTNLLVVLDHLPQNLCFFITGFSNTTASIGSLPFDLGPFGAPGCLARVSLDSTTLLVGSNGNALSSMTIPNLQSLLGAQLYQQALVIDSPANQLGAVVSNAAALMIGN
jgi:hypothetical protein